MVVRQLAVVSILFLTIISAGASGTNGEARVSVSPAQAIAGTYQNMKFEFTAGESAIGVSGGVRLELPVAYLETGPYFWDKPQTDLPEGRGYVKASTTGDADIEVTLYGANGGIIECSVKRGSISPGKQLVIHYSGIVQSYDWSVPVRVEWRETAQDSWKAVVNAPTFTVLPQKAAIMLAVAPADVKQNEGFDLAVVLMDKFGNRASGYRGTISLTCTDKDAECPQSYTFTSEDSGIHVFRGIQYKNSGFQRITASDGKLEAPSNYSAVWESTPKFKRYFGDTHFHTGTGTGNATFTLTAACGDHRGHFITEQAAYTYARDVMRLDFASAAEHDGPLMTENVWEQCQAITDSFNAPGKFTTFFVYEWTAVPREGHHLVVYKDRGNKVFDRRDYATKPDLWKALDQQGSPVLVIPHDMWAQPDHGIWENMNNKYRRIGEIYSLWNNRFLLQPADEPQRFELGINNRWSYQYAWHQGHRIGVIGSSDNHTGRPGLNNFTAEIQHPAGLAVALAKSNTREDIWDAFQQRRTYATTGTRIYVDFSSDGHPMGAEYSSGKPPVLSVKVAGTNTIVSVEIVKQDSKGYRTIRKETPESDICLFTHTDNTFTEDSFYYVRVSQVDEFKRGNWAYPINEMAWSSPIWVNSSK